MYEVEKQAEEQVTGSAVYALAKEKVFLVILQSSVLLLT